MLRQTAAGRQPITIGNNVVLTVLGVTNGQVRIGVDGPVAVRLISRGGGRHEQVHPALPQQAIPDPG